MIIANSLILRRAIQLMAISRKTLDIIFPYYNYLRFIDDWLSCTISTFPHYWRFVASDCSSQKKKEMPSNVIIEKTDTQIIVNCWQSYRWYSNQVNLTYIIYDLSIYLLRDKFSQADTTEK